MTKTKGAKRSAKKMNTYFATFKTDVDIHLQVEAESHEDAVRLLEKQVAIYKQKIADLSSPDAESAVEVWGHKPLSVLTLPECLTDQEQHVIIQRLREWKPIFGKNWPVKTQHAVVGKTSEAGGRTKRS